MTTRLNPYLTFSGNAREAMEFYQSVLGGELTLNTHGSFDPPEKTDNPMANNIMHGVLETESGLTLMGADNYPSDAEYRPGNSMSISLSGDDEDELRGNWAKLIDGATVSVQLEKQKWGDVFGMCTDKYGVTWMVNITQPES